VAQDDDVTAARPLRIGLTLPTWPLRDGSYAGWPMLRYLARATDALGIDTLWVPDHLQRATPARGTFGFWECWTILTAAAEATTRIGIGPLIACTGFRNPALLAKMAATLDEVSGGRLVLGLGSGVPARDPSWAAFGYDGTRPVAKYAEAVEIITRLLREDTVTFEGEHYRTDGATILPRGPRPGGPPVLVAGVGERTMGIAARFGDLVNVNRAIASVEDATAVVGLARRACEEVGRDPATLEVTGWCRLAVDGQGIAVERPGFIAGDPATVGATVATVHAAGVADLTFYVGTADDPSPLPALTEDTLERFEPFLQAIRAAA
jgi:alkanesulfonate monooxygenase SsuD/methylene tetrahydromethanopterin reductase-like flavin-dependent oxidoreductase (luciferase family)